MFTAIFKMQIKAKNSLDKLNVDDQDLFGYAKT